MLLAFSLPWKESREALVRGNSVAAVLGLALRGGLSGEGWTPMSLLPQLLQKASSAERKDLFLDFGWYL